MGKFYVWSPDMADDGFDMTARDEETAARLYAEKSYQDEPFDDQPMEIWVKCDDVEKCFWVTPTPTVIFDVVAK